MLRPNYAVTFAILLGTGLQATSAAYAQDPGFVARQNCEEAAINEIRGKFPAAGRIGFDGPRLSQISNAETGVSGTGKFDGRRGSTRFSYRCTYNIRNGRAYGVHVRPMGGYDGSYNHKDHKDSAGKIIGAIVGAAIVGAIADSANKGHNQDRYLDKNGEFSPSPGVNCNPRMSMCFEYGAYSSRWTRRIYAR